jgi:hypothetical protein
LARSAAEIQAEIRLSRRAIEAHLDALEHRTRYRRWAPWLMGGSALLVGLALSRLPVYRALRLTMGTLAAMVTAAQMVESGRRALADHRAATSARALTAGAAGGAGDRSSPDALAPPAQPERPR